MATYLHNRHATNLASFGRVLYNSERDGRMIAAGFPCARACIVQYHTSVAAVVDFSVDFDNDPRFGTVFCVGADQGCSGIEKKDPGSIFFLRRVELD